MQELIGSQPQNLQHIEIELADRAFGVVGEQEIELVLPPQRACDEIGCERTIALVEQGRPNGGERRGKVALCRGHGAKRFKCGETGG